LSEHTHTHTHTSVVFCFGGFPSCPQLPHTHTHNTHTYERSFLFWRLSLLSTATAPRIGSGAVMCPDSFVDFGAI